MSVEQAVTILDGGMGRELQKRGAPFRQPEWSALALMESPEVVCDAHRAFIQSGAEVIITNSYALVPFHIGEERFSAQAMQLADLSGVVAKQASAAEGNKAKVAGSIPPLFGSYRPELFQPARAAEIASELINGLAPHVDIWLAETQSLIAESVSVYQQIRLLDPTEKPFWVSFTIEDSEPTEQPQIRSGESVKQAVEAMVELDVNAILFNCSQPEVMEEALIVARQTLETRQVNSIELGVYANAFPSISKGVVANNGLNALRDDLNYSLYTELAEKWRAQGATLIGGCCGIGPEHIEELTKRFGKR